MRTNRRIRAALSMAAFLALGGVYAAAQSVPSTTIIATGMAAPGTTGATIGTIPSGLATTFPTIAIANDGIVTYLANLTGGDVVARSTTAIGNGEAVYQWNPATGTTTLVLRRGDLLPGSADTFFGQPQVTSASTNFVTSIAGGPGGAIAMTTWTYPATSFANTTDTRYFYGTPGSLTQVAREGDAAVGLTGKYYQSVTSTGVTGGNLYPHLNVNSSGFYFEANMSATAAGTTDIGEMLYKYTTSDGLQLLANTAHSASGLAGTSISLSGGGTAQVASFLAALLRPTSSNGVLITPMTLVTGGAVTTSNDNVLAMYTPGGGLSALVREGDATPDIVDANFGGVGFDDYDIVSPTPTTNAYVLRIPLAGAGVNTVNENDRNAMALYATDVNGGNFGLLVREGDIVPSPPTSPWPHTPPASFTGNMEFNSSFEAPRMSESGWVVFKAQLRYSTTVASETTGGGVGGSTTEYFGLYMARKNTDGSKEVREVALDRDASRMSMARFGILRGNDSELITHWIDPGQGTSLSYTINSSGKVLYYSNLGAATTATTTDGTTGGLFVYDPVLDRVQRIALLNDTLLVDGTPRQITSISALGGDWTAGSNDGYRSNFTDDGKIYFKVAYSGGEALMMINYADLLPPVVTTWKSDADGNGSDPANWDAVVPNGEGHEANFLGAITAPRTVTLDVDRKLGYAYFENANAYTIAGPGKLILDNINAFARLGVIAGSHSITAPVELLDDVHVIVDKAADVLTISSTVSGAKGINKGGLGTLLLSGVNTFSGPVRAAFGTVEVNALSGLGDGSATNTIVLDGGVIKYNASVTESRAINITTATTATLFVGGIDTGANEVTLTGAMSAPASSGFFNKHGTGKLIMAGTGGPSGVNVRAGTLEIGNAQTWGTATTTVSGGATLAIPNGKSLTTGGAMTVAAGGVLNVVAGGSLTTGGTLTLSGGTTTTLDGTATIGGTLLASYSATDGPALVTVNAPLTATALTVGNTTSPADPGNPTKVTLNAPVVTTGTGTNFIHHTLKINTGGSLATTGNIALDTAGTIITAGPVSTARRLEFDRPIVAEPGGNVAAAQLSIGSAAGVTVDFSLNVVGTDNAGTDNRGTASTLGSFTIAPTGTLTTNNQFQFGSSPATGTVDGTLNVGGLVVGESTSTSISHNLVINGTATASSKTVPGTTPLVTTGEFRMSVAATSTLVVDSNLKTEVNAGGSLTSTALNLASRTSSATAAVNVLTADLTFDAKAGSTLTTGPILISTQEQLAGRNAATHTLNFAGTATANSIRQTSTLAATPLNEPSVGIVNISIPGTLALRASSAGGATSLLRKVPDFAATGKLDLNDNDLAINYVATDPDPGPALLAAVASGRAAGATWDGVGIGSLAAKNNPLTNTGLAVGSAAAVLGLSGATTATWSGVTVDATSYLVKYTYVGDANFDGRIDIDDYFKIDTGYALAPANPGYVNGNFDYDNDIDGDDYFAIDKSFLTQSGVLSGGIAAPTAVPEPSVFALLAAGGLLLARRRRS